MHGLLLRLSNLVPCYLYFIDFKASKRNCKNRMEIIDCCKHREIFPSHFYLIPGSKRRLLNNALCKYKHNNIYKLFDSLFSKGGYLY